MVPSFETYTHTMANPIPPMAILLGSPRVLLLNDLFMLRSPIKAPLLRPGMNIAPSPAYSFSSHPSAYKRV